MVYLKAKDINQKVWIPRFDSDDSICAGIDWKDVNYLKRGLDNEDI